MSDVVQHVFFPTEEVNKKSYIKSMEQYRKMHKESIDNPATFWRESIRSLQWHRQINDHGQPLTYNFDLRNGPIYIKFMEEASTNACYNLLDVHLKNGLGDRVAIYWEGNHPNDHITLTYKDLHREVCKFANVLKLHNIKPGDRVIIYLPMIVEAMIAMLSCARLGAVHTVVFAGFSSAALCERIVDCQPHFLITADGAWRGTKLLHLKNIADEAMKRAMVDHEVVVRVCIVVQHLPRVTSAGKTDDNVNLYMMPERDMFWHEMMKSSSDACEPEWMNSEDPLFMLYTSGSTGKPKGVVHTTGGYLVYAAMTFKFVFDYTPDDVYFCTADIGWITGHTYCVYGPLMNAATLIMFEGTPFYPDNDRYWAIIEKYKVNQFYTAPTALRALMKFGDENVTKHNLQSLRILGSVGEPINPEAWHWYFKVVGNSKCSIVDTFWQTETGGHVLTPLPGATPMKPGSAVHPFFGVDAHILNDEGVRMEGEGEGYLVFSKPWPGMMRTLYNNHKRYEETYFTQFPGYYCTGDGARRDSDGYLWVTGRIDDMLNVSGHLMSTAEVEGVLTEHPHVTEAAVVAEPHPIKGQALYCFISINEDAHFNKELVSELRKKVREKIGPFAMPDTLQYAPGLPKTRSGKIMRRILRKIAVNDRNVGDTSTLADEGIVDQLFANRPCRGASDNN